MYPTLTANDLKLIISQNEGSCNLTLKDKVGNSEVLYSLNNIDKLKKDVNSWSYSDK